MFDIHAARNISVSCLAMLKFFDNEAAPWISARYSYVRARLTKTVSYLVLLIILVATLVVVFVYTSVKNHEVCQCMGLPTSIGLKTAGHHMTTQPHPPQDTTGRTTGHEKVRSVA